MTLFLSTLTAGRGGSPTLYDRNCELHEVRENDYLRYLPAKDSVKVPPPEDADDDDDEDELLI